MFTCRLSRAGLALILAATGTTITAAGTNGGETETFQWHKIEIQGNKKRLRLDEGPWQRYLGDERDLQVHDGRGNRVYLDVSELKEDFSGDVMIGVHGQIHEVLFPEFALQK